MKNFYALSVVFLLVVTLLTSTLAATIDGPRLQGLTSLHDVEQSYLY